MYKLVTAAVAAAMTLAAGIVSAEPVKIKFSHVVAENTPKGQMALRFKELVESKLAGKYVVEVYPNSQLFGDGKVLEAMLLGDVQIAAPSLSKFNKYTKKLQVFDLPFLFKDMTAVEKFQSGPKGQELLASMESKGLLGLGYLHNGLKQLSANSELRNPTDANGLKFRIQASDVLAAQFEAIGALPLKKPFSEVFLLLQTKGIDGQENTWSNIFSKKFFEVQKHITASNHGLIDYLVVTSAEFWNSVPDADRAVLNAAMKDAIAHGNMIAAEKVSSDRKRIEDSGISTILELSDAERAKWVDAMKPVWAKFADQIGQDLIDAAVASNN
ncbi:DctP family TRAP transporter solute-binding subunit [Sneathiella sp. P13V-1]|uniref:TRAP transporter substrate-binding protein n=1 Tax=Sneathiella sp. P13V-1 TaxID=2697366 RepID=UPI00187B5763|nr:TRAP transporter substrate-binding protein [Sneathiella sp. P13V-1]MBE7635542.1 DctP family TRAP transporter solute-binding subunit [Sneathiella sp. P13V-1]